MDLARQKLSNLPSRHKSRRELRLATSSPVLHQQYQSDEEQPSPTPDDGDNGSEYLSCEVSSEEDFETHSEDDLDFDEDFDARIALPVIFVAAAEAVAMPIRAVGRPNMVSISTLAPMQKRTLPISRPESASFTILRRFKAPLPTTLRGTVYQPVEPVRPVMTRNFSTPIQRSEYNVPSHSYSGSSPSSSLSSLSSGPTSDVEEADLLIRESNEIQDRSRTLLAGTEWDLALESQTPTTYEEYDPFALRPPTLITAKPYRFPEPETPGKARAWSRFALRTKFMAADRKTSKF